MKKDSFRLVVPEILKCVQILYQTGEITCIEKDTICRQLFLGDTDSILEKAETLAFYGSEAAMTMLETVQRATA